MSPMDVIDKSFEGCNPDRALAFGSLESMSAWTDPHLSFALMGSKAIE
jgi:hypothetical protein